MSQLDPSQATCHLSVSWGSVQVVLNLIKTKELILDKKGGSKDTRLSISMELW